MTTKLTLKLNKRVINRAKKLASERNTSVSKLVENYLDLISKNSKSEDVKLTPMVKSLIGSVRLPPEFDYKKEYADYLLKKHFKFFLKADTFHY